ncbi:MAG: hypothetical protein COV67_09235 [Nitrospinae bacterium CG11_big_fil_rev_8_21_14_0_20_56_8]|nr:MAG: hypothetical protein COV67_09235 [Nitrospinae bacterium CG11_big_fil_rev_8_21_14_0_20_56_8]
MPALKVIVAVLFFIFIASLAVKNMNAVELTYYDYKLQTHSFHLPLMVVILVPFVLGIFSAWFLGAVSRLRLRTEFRRHSRTIQSLQEELDRLKGPSVSSEIIPENPNHS